VLVPEIPIFFDNMMLLLRGGFGFSSGDGSVVAVPKSSSLLLLICIAILSCCRAYFIGTPVQNHQRLVLPSPKHQERRTALNLSRFPRRRVSSLLLSAFSSLETDIASLCGNGQFEKAIKSLEQLPPDESLKSGYTQILKCLVDRQEQLLEERITELNNKTTWETSSDDDYTLHLHQADKILKKLLELGKKQNSDRLLPDAENFNDVIKMWGSSTFVENASVRCQSHLQSLWTLYHKLGEDRFVPFFESYYCAVSACSGRDRGAEAANRAENLMEEMQYRCKDHAELTPDRSIANGVMNAWSKSGKKYKKGKKCEQMLEEMIEIAQTKENGSGRNMAPDTNSFNILLNALANCFEKNSEVRAEALLEKMEFLSSNGSPVLDCAPDEISFNTVLNCWAMSRRKGAAERATAILNHMKKRHEAGLTAVHPDWSSYTTVLKAWARCRDSDAIDRAEAVFEEYREACESGKWGFSHNAFAYNSMINCYAKSKHRDAGKRALELFQTMKANIGKQGWELCFVDIYTYTSLIDAISKQHSHEGSKHAIFLLEEIEESFANTRDVRFQPNIRLYTSVVNAIGRSHKDPDRAKAIVDRVESSILEGLKLEKEVKPDVVFYNALINAYGWSDLEGRSRKSFEILKHMISLFESGKLLDAKPDTVSFNSVLNACAHEKTDDREKSDAIMEIVVEAFELLSNGSSQEYGRPDQNTYIQILDSIASHMAKKRFQTNTDGGSHLPPVRFQRSGRSDGDPEALRDGSDFKV